MHKSRLGAIVIDCEGDDFERDVAFWSAALGRDSERPEDPADRNYMSLKTRPDELPVVLQKVDHPSRVHIDIEADDIEAEAAALKATHWQDRLPDVIRSCASGQELIQGGYPQDVTFACQTGVSQTVPVLSDGAFIAA